MSDLGDVITALANRIKAGMGSDALSGRTFDYAIDSPNTPCAIVIPDPGSDFADYDVTIDGAQDFSLIVKVLVSTAVSRTAQDLLQGYLAKTGTTSIRAAIYGDRTLGGVADDVIVTGAQAYGDIEYAGVTYLGADLAVKVFA